jgi:hypothetical protein
MVMKKKPVRDLPKGYVPSGGVKFDVSGTSPRWNWQTVAEKHGLKDVWKDLIEFNFPTVAYERDFQDKCAAVNWLLEDRVGCTVSHDGKNYSFENARIGYIYVPTVVTNDVGVRAARSVLAVLGSPFVNDIDFILISKFNKSRMFIHPRFFRDVAHALLDGKMGIAVNPGGIDHHAEAEYDYTTSPPLFKLRYSQMETAFQKSAVIHEAVHAINHLKGTDRLSHFCESSAYLAQAIYHRRLTGRRVEYRQQPLVDDICRVADDMARKVLKRQQLEESDSQAIEQKVVLEHGLKTYRYSAYPIPK